MSRARDPSVINAFSTALREFRLEAGLTQEGLALGAGVDRTFVGLLEAGKRQPSLSVIWALAYALGRTPQSLVARVCELVSRKSSA